MGSVGVESPSTLPRLHQLRCLAMEDLLVGSSHRVGLVYASAAPVNAYLNELEVCIWGIRDVLPLRLKGEY